MRFPGARLGRRPSPGGKSGSSAPPGYGRARSGQSKWAPPSPKSKRLRMQPTPPRTKRSRDRIPDRVRPVMPTAAAWEELPRAPARSTQTRRRKMNRSQEQAPACQTAQPPSPQTTSLLSAARLRESSHSSSPCPRPCTSRKDGRRQKSSAPLPQTPWFANDPPAFDSTQPPAKSASARHLDKWRKQ